jgi:hypothetical protein
MLVMPFEGAASESVRRLSTAVVLTTLLIVDRQGDIEEKFKCRANENE